MSELVEIEDLRGSYLNGCGVGVVEWCGLELTDQEHDELWNDINETDLLEQAGAFVEVYREVDDALPGMNDTYYTVWYESEADLKRDLKAEIISIVRNPK
jgi:hypothetical protein